MTLDIDIPCSKCLVKCMCKKRLLYIDQFELSHEALVTRYISTLQKECPKIKNYVIYRLSQNPVLHVHDEIFDFSRVVEVLDEIFNFKRGDLQTFESY